uniref:Transmembrane GTPase Marf-like n=1 Tax=Crassostrea virginica TaxID=6565 RepID=A0A8B8E6L5_CRAVI|nr:transmembrane GTPase Marf-like [Crassostrea virginica]
MGERVKAVTTKEHVINLYRDVILFLKSDDFVEDLRDELRKFLPDYHEILEKRSKDIEKDDHGIVVAGETSSGKSTLINKILQKEIFKGKNNESTSTICKIRNTDKIRIITENGSGKTKEIDLSNKYDLETNTGIRGFRKELEELIDLKKDSTYNEHCSVDIGFPIPLLKGNTILVDTPGVGGSTNSTDKLMEYLSNAVSFIFVINVGSAGGMQNDRLPVILRSLVTMMIQNEMPCFDPRDVLFITNKWDVIPKKEENDSSEDEETKTWETLNRDLKRNWIAVKEENIFKLSLKDVSPTTDNSSTAQFNKFKTVLETNIRKAENIRVISHLSFLRELLDQITNMVEERCKWTKLSTEEKRMQARKKQHKLLQLEQKCAQKSSSLLLKIQQRK